MSQFQLCIVGGGGIARVHIRAAKSLGADVIAVVDPIESARQLAADAAGAKGFATFDEFLAASESRRASGVIVCTPPSARVSIVKGALERGIAVLMEKPIAHTLADAKTLASLAQRHSNVTTAVGYCHRFTPAIAEMKKRIAAGDIGDVTRFENTFAAPLPRLKDHWMSDPAVSGGGSFIDTGCHGLDLFLHLIGRGAVLSAVFAHAWPGRGESSATALLRSERGGVAGVVQSGWAEPARFVLTVVGTNGSLSYDYDHPTELRFRSNDGPANTITVERHELRFARQLEGFIDLATGKSPSIPPATFPEGVVVAQQVDDAQRLART
jgi:predicted dehydrogenase